MMRGLLHGLLLLLMMGSSSLTRATPNIVGDFCFFEHFNASCGPNDVVMMTTARYGRMKKVHCLQQPSHMDCWADVLQDLDNRCSGRHDCLIAVPDQTLQNKQPCPRDMSTYLEAGYTCLPVTYNETWICHSQTTIPVQSESGYLSSLTTAETGLGSRHCPWRITVAHGQRVNLTLLDFGVAARASKQTGSICQVYARVKEGSSEMPICGGDERERKFYISDTNEIEVTILVSKDDPAYFVLKYDVLGCADPVVPKGAWMKRKGRDHDQAEIVCNYTTQASHIVCIDNDWYGKFDNCTIVSENPKSHSFASSKGDFPYGLMVAVLTGLFLGVLIGVALLAVVILCHKRRRRLLRNPSRAPSHAHETGGVDSVQGTPFLMADHKGNKPPDSGDSGYGYTHVCDVTIYQPYTHRHLSSFRKDTSTPPPSSVAALPLGTEQQDSYERATGLRKASLITSTPGSIRDARFLGDFEMDQNVNSPVHKVPFPGENIRPNDH